MTTNTQQLLANSMVGLGQIDDHHGRVFALINDLRRDQMDVITSEQFSLLYEKVYAVKDEFNEEEKLMVETESSAEIVRQHKRERSMLLERMYEVLFDAMHHIRTPTTKICERLRFEIQGHIDKYDIPTFRSN